MKLAVTAKIKMILIFLSNYKESGDIELMCSMTDCSMKC